MALVGGDVLAGLRVHDLEFPPGIEAVGLPCAEQFL